MALLFCSAGIALAGSGFEIRIKLDNYTENVLYLGYHYGDKQYIRDSSTTRNAAGEFVFTADTLLENGIYLIVLAPEKKYFQIILDKNEQRFSITTDATQPDKTVVFKGSPQNTLFYQYMHYLAEIKRSVDTIRQEMDSLADESAKEPFQEKLKRKNEEVRSYQAKIVKDHPGYLLSAIIKTNLEIEVPEFEGPEDTVAYKKFYYTRAHFFDNTDMNDGRLIRTPVLFQKVDAYVNKYHAIMPDSTIRAVESVLGKLKNNQDAFRFFLAHFLNTYSKSKYVGMDAVYVYLVDNYYAKGMAPWMDEENLAKIVKNANTLRPILLGCKAPELLMQDEAGKEVSLHGTDAKITVLMFWAPDCGHCQKSMPDVIKFVEDFAPRGVKMFSVCGKVGDVADCWKMVRSKKMQSMINVVDPHYKTRFKEKYDVQTTPKIYILDENKVILSKNIGVEQLNEIVDRMLTEQSNTGSKS